VIARAVATAARLGWRVVCALTLRHDLAFAARCRVNVDGWWAYRCRRCGDLPFASVWGGIDEHADERDA